MVTQVDWWQIKNAPPLGQTVIDDYPISTGPYTVPIVLVNNDGGLRVDDFQALNTIRASLTQQGVIGTLGGQSLAGPFFLVGNPSNQAPPAFVTLFYSAVCQDGNLAFYVASDGAISDPNAEIDYENALNGPLLTMTCEGELNLVGGNSVQSDVWLRNNWTGSYFRFLGTASAPSDESIILSTPQTILLEAAGISAFLGTDSFGNPAVLALDGILPAFSVNGNNGVYGSDPIGNIFDGGICVTLGSGSSFGIGTPVSGGTPTEILYVDALGNLAQTANIDTDGTTITLTDPVFGHTLLIAPDVAGVGGRLSANFGFTLDGAGSRIQLIANAFINFAPTNATVNFQMDNARFLTGLPIYFNPMPDISSPSPDAGLERNAPGDLSFTDAAGTTYATLGVSGLFLAGQAGPVAPTGGGILYVDIGGALHYIGGAGTDTTIAPA